jgi:HlyD family secretion protein
LQLVAQARAQQDVVASEIDAARLSVTQAGNDSSGQIAQAESAVASAQAQLAAAEAETRAARAQFGLAAVTNARTSALARSGDVSRQSYDQSKTALESARQLVAARDAAVVAAKRQVSSAAGALARAEASSLNAPMASARVASLRGERDAAGTQLRGALAQVADARAAYDQILARLADSNVRSPIDGVITARAVEPGTVVPSGKTLLTVIDPSAVYLRGFVAEGSIGRVRIGERANVFLDSAPDKPLAGHVSEIDTEASFTPENVYFRDDRVKQVFGIKISIDRPQGLAKPGMPADATLLN